MSGVGRGRGRGRGTHIPREMREPDKNMVEKIYQEKASITTKSENAMSSPPPTPTPDPDQISDQSVNDSALTTIGKGKLAPAIQDVKDAVRGGVQIKEQPYPTAVPLCLKQLDPLVDPFVPSIHTHVSSKGVSSYLTKFTANNSSNSSSPNVPNISRLNPESREFVPNLVSNGDAFLDNGNMGLDVEKEEANLGWCDVKDILRGFEWAAPKDVDDSSFDLVLIAGAELLLKVYNYPASFNKIGKNFEGTLRGYSPSDSALINLAEMLIYWGVEAPEIRYSSCKICHLITEMEDVKNFKCILFVRLQEWHKKASTDNEELWSLNFFGFLSEIYSKITVGGEPVDVLGNIVFSDVIKLLDMGRESFIREACNILKLTGSNLLKVKDYACQIRSVNKKMTELTMDGSLSKTCIHLILQVMELIGCEWRVAASPIQPAPSFSDRQNTAGVPTTRLNTDAPPFIPGVHVTSYSHQVIQENTDAASFIHTACDDTSYNHQVIQENTDAASFPTAFDETSYNHQLIQEPVAQVEEWYDFVGDDHTFETDNQDYDDEGLDPEIELEMEAFIEEIEEQLVLQDFDRGLYRDP